MAFALAVSLLVSSKNGIHFVALTSTRRGTSRRRINGAVTSPIATFCTPNRLSAFAHAVLGASLTKSQIDDDVVRSKMRREITVRVREIRRRLTLPIYERPTLSNLRGPITQVLVSTVLPGLDTSEGTVPLPRSQK